MEERFVADRNLGKLAKWLRILGYDTLYDRGDADQDFLRRAAEDGRIALTRKRDLARLTHPGSLVVVKADRVEAQIGEVLKALDLQPDPSRADDPLPAAATRRWRRFRRRPSKASFPPMSTGHIPAFRRCPLLREDLLAGDAHPSMSRSTSGRAFPLYRLFP